MKLIPVCLAALLVSAHATSQAQTPDPKVEAFLWDYTKAWNKHDAATLARDFYRLPGTDVAAQTAANEKTFADLIAQGYDKSDIHEIKGCVTGADTAWAGMKFTRLKTDGSVMPPKDRAASYDLKKFPDGWRIVKLGGGDPAKPLECPKG